MEMEDSRSIRFTSGTAILAQGEELHFICNKEKMIIILHQVIFFAYTRTTFDQLHGGRKKITAKGVDTKWLVILFFSCGVVLLYFETPVFISLKFFYLSRESVVTNRPRKLRCQHSTLLLPIRKSTKNNRVQKSSGLDQPRPDQLGSKVKHDHVTERDGETPVEFKTQNQHNAPPQKSSGCQVNGCFPWPTGVVATVIKDHQFSLPSCKIMIS